MNSNKLWHHALTFSTEAGCVIVLRAVKLSGGGLPAVDEAWRIVTEKTIAMGETSVRAMQGKRPLSPWSSPIAGRSGTICAGSRRGANKKRPPGMRGGSGPGKAISIVLCATRRLEWLR